jgi:NADH dehydrogenase/NADH:ubiquinone oxidoreductase subunit G
VRKDMVVSGISIEEWVEDINPDYVTGQIRTILEKDNRKIIEVWASIGNRRFAFALYFMYDNDVLVKTISPYEVFSAFANEKRGFVVVSGHETIHTIWIDDFEVNVYHTR